MPYAAVEDAIGLQPAPNVVTGDILHDGEEVCTHTERERSSKVGRTVQMKYRKVEDAECSKVAQKTLVSGCDKGDAARAARYCVQV